MKTTTTKYVTKLIVEKPFKYHTGIGFTLLKKGRVLETVKHKNKYFYPWVHRIVLGHGWNEIVPIENVKVKWFKEVKTVITKTKEVKVIEKKA